MFAAVEGFVVFIIIAIVILLIPPTYIRVVSQTWALAVKRLGAYQETYGVGIHFLIPFADRVIKKVNLKEQMKDFPPRLVITRDNVTMWIGIVVFSHITSPKLYVHGVGRPLLTTENLTVTTLCNIIDDLELDQILTSRETINAKMQESLGITADPWDIKVIRVELKNIVPPSVIQEVMEEQMKAERERRESTLRAEGKKRSIILIVEGNEESAMLNMETEKEAAIFRAEAEKEREIGETQGQAEAIRSVQQATADGIRSTREAGADNAVFQLKSLEAFQTATNGKANKIIIPLDIQGTAEMVKSTAEVAAKDEGAE